MKTTEFTMPEITISYKDGKSSVRCPLKPSDSIPLCPNNPAH
jgi:hypothetical protein